MQFSKMKNLLSQIKKKTNASGGGQPKAPPPKAGLNLMRFMGVFVSFSILFWLAFVITEPLSNGLCTVVQKAKLDENLIPKGFDEKSCLSRFESARYRRGMPQKVSPYLLSKFRSYEARHRRCGVYTESYNKTMQLLKAGGIYNSSTDVDCRYIVWISFEGLGDKMLTLASAFLYALLTDRVLLVDRGRDLDIPDLFCEPFPEVSWFLPLDFPLSDQLSSFNKESNQSYVNVMVKRNSTTPQPYIYLNLVYGYDEQDRHFFCDDDQAYLHGIPWLLMKSCFYIVPGFFLIPSFEQELNNFFPDKGAVFHLLARYLLHPTNSVWELVTAYYRGYLSKADQIVGIQVSSSGSDNGPFKYDQILSCAKTDSILPQVILQQEHINSNTTSNTTKVAILVVSQSSSHFEQLRSLYLDNPTATGEVVGVFHPSTEYQQTNKHDRLLKEMAEIYLLSFSDKLVTSGMSTYGYVAQSLGGLRAWLLYWPDNDKQPDPPCRRVFSMEPCFHSPPNYDCKFKKGRDTSSGVPHVRHCEDSEWAIKMF